MICLATVQNRGKDTHYRFYVVDVSESGGGRIFLFSWEIVGRGIEGVCRKLLSPVKLYQIRGFGYKK